MKRSRALLATAAALIGISMADPAAAQWVKESEQFYMPADHNWVFRRNYPGADRLFNAFDYGHAILYEKLYTRPGAPASLLEEEEYDFITRKLLVSPPRMPLEEAAIEVEYVKLAPEAKLMFEWAHVLHRQIYDILGDARLSEEEKDREVAALIRYYKSRPDLAFSSVPKNMELMEGQYYSTAFREGYPKFNGLIWAYHWLQVGLYEPLLTGKTVDERQAGITAAVTRFRQMLVNAPENMPRVMPMTAAIAPEFTRRYSEAAIIFDNLHGMHDVISDILASDSVPRERKREEILRAAERYRDATSFTMTVPEWLQMAQMMGANNMGGPVTGFLAAFPQPTVERGAVMAGMDHGAMGGTTAGAMAGMDHSAMPGMPAAAGSPSAGAAGEHAGHTAATSGSVGSTNSGQSGMMDMGKMMEIHERMMADPVIRERVQTDPELQRMMQEMHGGGLQSTSASGGTAANAEAIDFVVRLLSDPEVEARIHTDPRLHQLWIDPAVQRRLSELRAAKGGAATGAAAEHNH